MWRTEFFVILDCFWPFYPPSNPQNQNLEKMKTLPTDITTIHKYHNWKSYNVWFLRYGACDRQNFLSFWTVFCLFIYSLNNPKNQNFEKLKKHLAISSFYTSVQKLMIICYIYCSLYMAHNRFNCYFSFGAIFYPFTSLRAKKLKFRKMKKTPGDIIILQQSGHFLAVYCMR